MKELTIEEKAARYDEALEKANFYKENTDGVGAKDVSELIEGIFPELVESEDERIMNQLHSWMKEFGGAEEYTEKVYQWLKGLIEKQGEKTEPIEGFNTEFERQISHLIASIINKEHEYTKDFVKWTSDVLLNYAKHEIEKQGEQKPAWSEEDNKMLEDIISSINHESVIEGLKYRGINYSLDLSARLMEDLINWLKSIKNRIQSKSKLDDNQMKLLNELMSFLLTDCPKQWAKYGELLKSLKERYTWRPSDEQMERLKGTINSLPHQEVLYSLYQDLKKLKE